MQNLNLNLLSFFGHHKMDTFPHKDVGKVFANGATWSHVSGHLVAGCVCLLFGAELVVAQWCLLELFHLKRVPSAAEDDALRAVKAKRESKAGRLDDEPKMTKEEKPRGAADYGKNSL